MIVKKKYNYAPQAIILLGIGACFKSPIALLIPCFFVYGKPWIKDNQRRLMHCFTFEVFCVVSAYAKTGVEMEAIMGVNAALITIYDLSKIVNPHLKIHDVKLLIKEGGKSGLWKNPDGLPNFLKEIF